MEKGNLPKFINNNLPTKRIVDNFTINLKTSFKNKSDNNIRITTFNNTNPAYAPKSLENSLFFHSIPQVSYIFKHLPNKSSAGLNNIPPIVLKHLPPQIIIDYTIIFNNCLNNKYCPNDWKTAKLLPLLKKKTNHQIKSLASDLLASLQLLAKFLRQ